MSDHARLAALLFEKERREAVRLFPDEGPLRRELYPKHLQFFRYGATKAFRAFIAANRVGKTTAACLELGFHLTGEYPHWWEGRRFDRPIGAWAASLDWTSNREGIQAKLFGKEGEPGTGLIPGWAIDPSRITYVPNTHGAIDKAYIRHVSGGWSELAFRSYKQGRVGFQMISRDVILLDEEPRDFGIFSESATRTLTVDGIVMCSFTSLFGVTKLVAKFLPELGKPEELDADADPDELEEGNIARDAMAAVICGWDDVPHIKERQKQILRATYEPHEIKARTTGHPGLSAGMVYPVDENDFVVDAFTIPKSWKRVAGFDPGWNKTAGVWLAVNPETGTAYLYSEYYKGKAEPEIHAAAMKARGDWIPIVSDNATDVKNGKGVIDTYRELGVKKIVAAKKSDKSRRLLLTLSCLSTGKLKVFRHCQWWLWEFRQYVTNETGEIASEHDHLMNATEYAIESGIPIAALNVTMPSTPLMQEHSFANY